MPFVGNVARQGTNRASSSTSADDWAGTVAAGATKILGPLQSVGTARVAWNVHIGGAVLPATVAIEYRVGPNWRLIFTPIPALGQPVIGDVVVAGREVRMRIVAPGGAPVVVTAASLFVASGT